MTFKLITIYIMSLFYTLMGLKHIFDPKYFAPMMPSILPYKFFLIYVSGSLELTLGFFLILDEYRFYAAVGLMILLVLIFPANIYIAFNESARKKMKVSKLFCLIRLLFQPILIFIAYWHSQ